MRLAPEYQPRKLPTFARTFKGNIELSGGSIRYSPQSAPALRVNLRIVEGSFVTPCRPNGAGKSTLLRVLAQLYLPQAGMSSSTVWITGSRCQMLREQLGYVQEKQAVFTGTIAENIRLAHPRRRMSKIAPFWKSWARAMCWPMGTRHPLPLDRITRCWAPRILSKDHLAPLSSRGRPSTVGRSDVRARRRRRRALKQKLLR